MISVHHHSSLSYEQMVYCYDSFVTAVTSTSGLWKENVNFLHLFFFHFPQNVKKCLMVLFDRKFQLVNCQFTFLLVGTWLPPDGITDVSGNLQSAKAEDTKPSTSNSEKTNSNSQLPSHLLSYYSHISKIILGNSESLMKVCLSIFCQFYFTLLAPYSDVFIIIIYCDLCSPYSYMKIKLFTQAPDFFCQKSTIRM